MHCRERTVPENEGNSLNKVQGKVSLAECVSACEANFKCNAAAWGDDGQSSDQIANKEPRYCWLKSGFDSASAVWDRDISYAKYFHFCYYQGGTFLPSCSVSHRFTYPH